MPAIIDSYAHCGLSKYRPIADVLDAHRRAGVTGGVLAQHMGETDNAYIVAAAHTAGPMYRAAVMVDPASEGWADELRRLAVDPAVAAVRVVADETTSWPAVSRTAAGLDLCTISYHPAWAPAAGATLRRLAADFPGVPFVLSHLGAGHRGPPRTAELERLADQPNVFLQLSGFTMWPGWDPQDVRLGIPRLVEAFGAQRLIWGSNFPVDDVADELQRVTASAWGLGADALRAVLDDNARAVWKIGRPSAPATPASCRG